MLFSPVSTGRRLAGAVAFVVGISALTLTPPAWSVDPTPVAGAQTSGDVLFPYVGNGGYDVSNYDLDFNWTAPTIPGVTSDSITATATITAATTGAPLSSYSLDLEGLTVDSVTVNGAAATFTRVDDNATIKHKLVITPSTPVSGTFTTVVTYHGTPISHTDADDSSEGWGRTSDGVVFLNQPVGSMTGFPNNNTPGDKATYDVSIEIPNTINLQSAAAVSNGELAAKAVNGSRTTWRWIQTRPMASMAMMISIGVYTVYDETIDLASGRHLKAYSFIDPLASGANGAVTAKNNLKSYIDFYESRYGPYPGNSTGIVVDNISPTAGINYALETQDRAFFPNSVSASTNIHETMHQWFGDGVAPKVWNDIWLSEGPATFAETLFPNEGASPATSTTTTEDEFYGLWNDTASDSANWTIPPAAMTDSADLFGWQVYNRGAMTLEALKAAIGTTDFNTLMRQWHSRFEGTSPGTAAFIDLAEEIEGRDLTAFFQDWIYDGNKPAWPSKFNLSLAPTPSTGPLQPGGSVSYAVTAVNTGRVPLTGAKVSVDLSGVLNEATITGSLPAGTTLNGTMLTWSVPSTATGASSVLTLPITINDAVPVTSLIARVEADENTLGSTCTTCASSLTVNRNPVRPASGPVITGTPAVGQTLTATVGPWDPAAALQFSWEADGTAIPGATGTSYEPVISDIGKALTVTVTGSRVGYTTVVRTSTPTALVALGTIPAVARPQILGKTKVGQKLTFAAPAVPAGVTVRFRWWIGSRVLGKVNQRSLKVKGSYRGHRIRLVMTLSRTGYKTVELSSALTRVVK